MYSTIHIIVAVVLSSFVTAAVSETLHWWKDRKKKANK